MKKANNPDAYRQNDDYIEDTSEFNRWKQPRGTTAAERMSAVLDMSDELRFIIEGFGAYPGIDNNVTVTAAQIGAGIEGGFGSDVIVDNRMMSNGIACFDKTECQVGLLGTQCRKNTTEG